MGNDEGWLKLLCNLYETKVLIFWIIFVKFTGEKEDHKNKSCNKSTQDLINLWIELYWKCLII